MLFLLEQCHAAFVQHYGVFTTLFLAGLVGGVTHCAGMCGPFVVAQVNSNKVNCGNEHAAALQKLSGAALLPYHFGRMTTYVTLGALAALLSKQIMGTPLQQWISVIFLSIAGVVFIATALPKTKQNLRVVRGQWFAQMGRFLGRITAKLFVKPVGLKGYPLGVLLGFLPCGLVFAALMVVATMGNPIGAAFAMVLFTVATFPALFLVGLGSQAIQRRWPEPMQRVARIIMIFNGLSLFFLAGKMVL